MLRRPTFRLELSRIGRLAWLSYLSYLVPILRDLLLVLLLFTFFTLLGCVMALGLLYIVLLIFDSNLAIELTFGRPAVIEAAKLKLRCIF